MSRRSNNRGHIEIPDEFGYCQGAATGHSENGGRLCFFKVFAAGPGEDVTVSRVSNGELASAVHARDQRASFIQRKHDQDCTGTCVKYEQKAKVPQSFLSVLVKRLLGPETAFIAPGEENEMVPGEGSLRSTSIDVLQSTHRCNADYHNRREHCQTSKTQNRSFLL